MQVIPPRVGSGNRAKHSDAPVGGKRKPEGTVFGIKSSIMLNDTKVKTGGH